MKASLQLTVNQHLTLTPQLQQAIRLLQLSTLELNQEIEKMIEINPLLEHDIPSERVSEDSPSEQSEQIEHTLCCDVALNQNSLTSELPVDTTWDILYPNNATKSNAQEESPNYENTHCTIPSLQEYLTWQMELAPFSDNDRIIAAIIIDSICPEGFLSVTIEELHESINARLSNSLEHFALEEVETVLQRIQHFDPIGIGARNLSECLVLQLTQLPPQTPHLQQAIQTAKSYLNELGNHNYKLLMQLLKVDEATLQKIIALIKSLNPQPGAKLLNNKTEYIIPDILVKKEQQRWLVELNPETVPRIRLNDSYLNLLQRDHSTGDHGYLKDNLQQAKWFIKSIENRHETLLKVACCIVEKQQDFLTHGAEAMRPMILSDVATQLEVHESTISRVTTQKFMHTPHGIFELKYFFSSHISTNSGGECSSTAIRAVIKKLIAAEDRCKPLSDHKISQLLNKQGINVARRTIAKYREALHIACSNERKDL